MRTDQDRIEREYAGSFTKRGASVRGRNYDRLLVAAIILSPDRSFLYFPYLNSIDRVFDGMGPCVFGPNHNWAADKVFLRWTVSSLEVCLSGEY